MRQRIRSTLLAVVAVIVLLMASGTAMSDETYCGHYNNSRASYIDGYGWACAYSGSTCRECTMMWSGGGYSVCIQQMGGILICTDHQN